MAKIDPFRMQSGLGGEYAPGYGSGVPDFTGPDKWEEQEEKNKRFADMTFDKRPGSNEALSVPGLQMPHYSLQGGGNSGPLGMAAQSFNPTSLLFQYLEGQRRQLLASLAAPYLGGLG